MANEQPKMNNAVYNAALESARNMKPSLKEYSEYKDTEVQPDASSQKNGGVSDLDNTNLYIKGLWKDCSQVDLDDLFKQFGVICQSRVYGDGVGFVRFEQGIFAKKAIEAMNGRKVGKCPDLLLVKYAFKKQRNSKRYIRVGDEVKQYEVEMIMNKNTNNVYLRCLPRGFTEAQLTDLCSPYGELTCTRLRESGVAFVRFRKSEDAVNAIRELNGKTFENHNERLLAKLANSDPFQPKIGFKQRPFDSDAGDQGNTNGSGSNEHDDVHDMSSVAESTNTMTPSIKDSHNSHNGHNGHNGHNNNTNQNVSNGNMNGSNQYHSHMNNNNNNNNNGMSNMNGMHRTPQHYPQQQHVPPNYYHNNGYNMHPNYHSNNAYNNGQMAVPPQSPNNTNYHVHMGNMPVPPHVQQHNNNIHANYHAANGNPSPYANAPYPYNYGYPYMNAQGPPQVQPHPQPQPQPQPQAQPQPPSSQYNNNANVYGNGVYGNVYGNANVSVPTQASQAYSNYNNGYNPNYNQSQAMNVNMNAMNVNQKVVNSPNGGDVSPAKSMQNPSIVNAPAYIPSNEISTNSHNSHNNDNNAVLSKLKPHNTQAVGLNPLLMQQAITNSLLQTGVPLHHGMYGPMSPPVSELSFGRRSAMSSLAGGGIHSLVDSIVAPANLTLNTVRPIVAGTPSNDISKLQTQLQDLSTIPTQPGGLNPSKSSNPHNVTKQLANQLHSTILKWYPQKGGKLTGMFLQEHDQKRTQKYLNSETKLKKKIDKYADLLSLTVVGNGNVTTNSIKK